LSQNSSDLDAQLSKIFDVASHWNALLLLDEADSFLRRRSNNSQHNALVAVFLRKLEYFSGIMLLATNRVTEFDDAVQSRIHVGIAYQPLGLDTRMSIWKSFLKRPNAEGRVVSFNGTEIQDLAERKLNGRQVSCLL
jgi:SpoVK/Ycf46/Vps4 family AAA+-type ATPase